MAAQNWVMIISELRRYQVSKARIAPTFLLINTTFTAGCLLQVWHHSDVRSGPWGPSGPGAEILRVWSTMSSGQLRWEVREIICQIVVGILWMKDIRQSGTYVCSEVFLFQLLNSYNGNNQVSRLTHIITMGGVWRPGQLRSKQNSTIHPCI